MCTGHLTITLDTENRRVAVAQACMELGRASVQFDAFVATGTSGLVFAASLADQMGKELVVVRKATDKASHGQPVEVSDHLDDGYRYVIVDDLVASGRTLIHVLDSMESHQPDALFVGMYLYHQGSRFYPAQEVRERWQGRYSPERARARAPQNEDPFFALVAALSLSPQTMKPLPTEVEALTPSG